MSDAVTQIHDDMVGDGHEMGETHDIVGDWGDEDIADDEIWEKHDIVGEMGGVNIGENIGDMRVGINSVSGENLRIHGSSFCGVN